MPTYAVHLPPAIKGAAERRLVVRNKFGSKVFDSKFDPNCTFIEAPLESDGKLQLIDGGVTVAEINLPNRPKPITVPPRPCDCPPAPEPVAEVPITKPDPHYREPFNVTKVAVAYLKRKKK